MPSEHNYTIDELMELENKIPEPFNIKETFEFLTEHRLFSHIDEKSNEKMNTYYFKFNDSEIQSELLFIDIPKTKGELDIYSDESSCLGREEWFDELFNFVNKMYNHYNQFLN